VTHNGKGQKTPSQLTSKTAKILYGRVGGGKRGDPSEWHFGVTEEEEFFGWSLEGESFHPLK
jgi:hypothetical protein